MACVAFSQQSEALIQAFSQSYAKETVGQYEEAINSLRPFLHSRSYETNLRFGWLYYLKEDYTQSAKHYSRAIKIMPLAIEAKLGYVLPESAMGNWNKVTNTYKDILQIDPKNSLVNYRIGLIYYNQGDFNKAYHHLELVINLYPFDYDTVILFAWINLKMGKISQGKALFHRALMIYPGSESAREGLNLLH